MPGPKPALRRSSKPAGQRMCAAMLPVVCAALLSGCSTSLNDVETGPTATGAVAFASAPAGGSDGAGALAKAADRYTAAATPGNNAYKIGPADVLEISVFKVPDLTKTVQVDDDGTINFPLVGELQAAGKTAHEVEHLLAGKLGAKYVRSPDVTVLVKEYNSQRVTVDGSIKKPGVYTLKGRTTLVQILATAEGVNIDLASGEAIIFRRINGQRSAAKFDVNAITDGRAEDPELQPGDVIEVDTSGTKVAFQNVLRALPLATLGAAFVPLL